MDPITGAALIGGGSALLGGIMNNQSNAKHQAEANQANERIAYENRVFQNNLSNTAYQRAMADMNKAGLNPMLAYSQGGASTPNGAMPNIQAAKMEDVLGKGVSAALETRRLAKELKAVDSQADLNRAAATTHAAQTLAQTSSAKESAARTEMLQAQLPSIKAEANLLERQAKEDAKHVKFDSITRRTKAVTGIVNDAAGIIRPSIRIQNAPKDQGRMKDGTKYRHSTGEIIP